MFDIIVLIIINLIGFKLVGSWFLGIEVVLMIVFFIYLWIKKYRPVIDRVNFFSGAPGTGKSKLMVDLAVNKYRSVLRSVKIRNFIFKLYNKIAPKKYKKEYLEIPRLYSNFPILWKRKTFSYALTDDIILLQKRLQYGSVVVIDEFSELASNQDYNNVYAKFNVDEFIRFFRQYTLGGWFYAADQSSDSVLVQVRRRIGKVYNLVGFRKLPFFKIAFTNVRHLSISEDIKVVESGQAENLKHNTNWLPLFFYKKRYDTYAFSNRVVDMEVADTQQFDKFKTNNLLSIPFKSNKDNSYKDTKSFKSDTSDKK